MKKQSVKEEGNLKRSDLSTLPDKSAENVSRCLRDRYNAHKIYINIGYRHMIALNPLKSLSLDDEQTSLEYASNYKEYSPLDSHLFNLINQVYFYMKRTASDQTVILRGVSGSGKSNIRHLSTRHLVQLCSLKKTSKIQTQIMKSQTILEAFGNCQKKDAESSSRFGYYLEIQFNQRGKIIGSKTTHYSLEASRVTADCKTDMINGNFNIFYYLLAGISPNEKAALHITDNLSFNYLQRFSKRTILPMDAGYFRDLKKAMKICGFKKEQVGRIFQVVATLLHLGNLGFVDSNGLSTQEAAVVRNTEVLDLVASFLGVDPQALCNVLTFKTTTIGKDVTTLFLNAQQASQQRDELVKVLYTLLFSWIVEKINERICQEDFSNSIGLLDFPGLQTDYPVAGFEQMCINLANERLQVYVTYTLSIEVDQEEMPHSLDVFVRPKGILEKINEMTSSQSTDRDLVDSIIKTNKSHQAFSFKKSETINRNFAIRHYGDNSVEYSTDGFLSQNNSIVSVDFQSLFKGEIDLKPSWNTFMTELFSNVKCQPKKDLQPSVIQTPSKRHLDREKSKERKPTVLYELQSSLDHLISHFHKTKLWTIYCLLCRKQDTGAFDSELVKSQLEMFNLPRMLQMQSIYYIESYDHQVFLDYYGHIFRGLDYAQPARLQCETAAAIMNYTLSDISITQNKIYISGAVWHDLEERLRISEKEVEQTKEEINIPLISKNDEYSTPHGFSAPFANSDTFHSEDETFMEHEESIYGSEIYGSQQGGLVLQEPAPVEEEEEDEKVVSAGRKRWLFFVYFCTWWIPLPCMVWFKMKRKDVQVAWREKVTLCMLIFFMCTFVIWFLIFFSEFVCPHQKVMTLSELENHNATHPKGAYFSIRGEVFNLTGFLPRHYPREFLPTEQMMEYAGKDVTDLFPIQVSAMCEGVSPFISLDFQVNSTDENSRYHDFRFITENYNPNWYYNQMRLLRKEFKMGNIAYEWKAIKDQAKQKFSVHGVEGLRTWAVIDDRIYDITAYSLGGRTASGPEGSEIPIDINTDFLNQQVVDLFRQKAGSDISDEIRTLGLSTEELERELVCLRNLFYAGEVDQRNSIQCKFSTYLLLIVTILLASIIVFKFFAAIRIGNRCSPEDYDKFVICQITCYTEDEVSLRKTIDSIGKLRYDDKRKLLFVICDGMIMGSGNDKPTPRIVLDILGVDPQVDPEPLSFLSLGDGNKQHNMGKIYSGLYEVSGHVVPYIVVAKCGNSHERQKPGNRGKRDSQLVLMQFLNRVHYDGPMNPLQLGIYHQMKNVIGVNPEFYEFVLMVDADTEVMPDGLNHLVSSAVHDSKIIGICGETNLSNEKDSWVTMIQVYEYFISHHLIKSFESLFSTVSCLPGCFTMYRIRTVDDKRALFISNELITDYSVNTVDTLHKKNLLHLGEDRYLTTLLLKHFSRFKTKFNSDAKCMTNAPDTWSVLISQRRRWINSTVHNLGELAFLPSLCGFCCFSMRFVVILDLVSTLVMPALMGYLGYLIYCLAHLDDGLIPVISIATIAGTYGLQALLFIVKGRWEFIMWMIVSLLATPVFSFYIPVYAYWHFDDFSWGNTRVVVGEKGGKTKMNTDEGIFDPKSIPTMKWSDYENQMAEDSWSDNVSHSSGYTQSSHQNSAYNDNTSVYSTVHPVLPQYDMSMMSGPQSRPMNFFSPVKMLSSPGPYIPLQNSSHSSRSLLMDSNTERPTNEEIIYHVNRILETADLTKITKKQIREELQAFFGTSMSSRKEYINTCIENRLNNRT